MKDKAGLSSAGRNRGLREKPRRERGTSFRRHRRVVVKSIARDIERDNDRIIAFTSRARRRRIDERGGSRDR